MELKEIGILWVLMELPKKDYILGKSYDRNNKVPVTRQSREDFSELPPKKEGLRQRVRLSGLT